MKHNQLPVRFLGFCSLILLGALLNGCASDKTNTKAEKEKPAKSGKAYKDKQYVANPTKVRFGEFKLVELKATEIAPKHRENKANQQSAAKIDEMLQQQLKYIFPDLKVIPKGGEFSQSAGRTLQISPSIEDIKLVSVGSRIWLGAMAGGSDIVMKVIYRDSSTGEVIADPDFWKGNNAWAGGSSWGAADNQIRDAVVSQIVTYTTGNK